MLMISLSSNETAEQIRNAIMSSTSASFLVDRLLETIGSDSERDRFTSAVEAHNRRDSGKHKNRNSWIRPFDERLGNEEKVLALRRGLRKLGFNVDGEY